VRTGPAGDTADQVLCMGRLLLAPDRDAEEAGDQDYWESSVSGVYSYSPLVALLLNTTRSYFCFGRMARAALVALVTFIPVLASILSFVSHGCTHLVDFVTGDCSHHTGIVCLVLQITYALSGHDLNIAIIFSSLQLFNVCPLAPSLAPPHTNPTPPGAHRSSACL